MDFFIILTATKKRLLDSTWRHRLKWEKPNCIGANNDSSGELKIRWRVKTENSMMLWARNRLYLIRLFHSKVLCKHYYARAEWKILAEFDSLWVFAETIQILIRTFASKFVVATMEKSIFSSKGNVFPHHVRGMRLRARHSIDRCHVEVFKHLSMLTCQNSAREIDYSLWLTML